MLDQIKKLCKAYGITPQRSKGQHFLMDATVIDTMVETARLDQRDTVLEVGPGLGILTEALVARAGRVVSVELDRKLFGLLQAKFIVSRNLELVNDDILRCDFAGRLGAGYKVVANLPYNITSRFLKNILTAAVKPLVAVVLVQKEVAERICAKPGDLSLLGISVQLYGRPAVVATVGRQQFWPMPAVDSAIVAIRDIQPAAAIAARRAVSSVIWASTWTSSDLRPAILISAPSGHKLPFNTTTPPLGCKAREQGRTTSPSGRGARFSSCARVRPESARQAPCR